ncbi:hypothetical protein Tco_0466380 [Tanacetum coccineum]
MSNTNSLIKGHWSNTKPGLGLSNIWYQSKTGRHLRRRQHLNFIQRELRRENEARLGSCIKQISMDCKEMLKKKMEEIMQKNKFEDMVSISKRAQFGLYASTTRGQGKMKAWMTGLDSIKGLEGYLSVYFGQEFDIIGEILGLSKGNGEKIKSATLLFGCSLTSYFKTARAPQQGYNTILEESTRKVEDKDRDCLMSHQWDFGETCEPTARTAVQKGKEKLEHLGVKLEDTEEGEDSQEQPTLSHSTRTQNLQGMIIGPSTSRITSNGESGSNTSDDFIIIT